MLSVVERVKNKYLLVDYDLTHIHFKVVNKDELPNTDAGIINYKISNSVKLPRYIYQTDEDIIPFTFKNNSINYYNNIFDAIYKRFKIINPVDIVNKYRDFDLIYDTTSLRLVSVSSKEYIDLFSPFLKWETSFDRASIIYNDYDNSLVKVFDNYPIFERNRVMFNKRTLASMNSLSLFRIEILALLEYNYIRLMCLNNIYNNYNHSGNTSLVLWDNPIYHSRFKIIDEKSIKPLFMFFNSLHYFSKCEEQCINYDNKSLALLYMTVLQSIDFENDVTFDYNSFIKVYRETSLQLCESMLLHLQWQFITRMKTVNTNNATISTSTPVGTIDLREGC